MEMQKKVKAALYIRVSTEEQAQEGQSAPAQVETLKNYCSTYGIEVYDVYMDLGFSGKSLDVRRELARLLEDCRRGRFNLVLVWKISRLSRSLKDLLHLIDVFESNNVHFASCSEKFDTSTPVGRMTLQLLGSIAEFERNTIVENVKLGLDEFSRKGGKASSVLGYDNVDKRLVVNEEEARIVKLIFSLFVKNSLNYSSIARHLNDLGCRTKRGCSFSSSSISYIIHNPVYIGINRHGMNTENEYSVIGSHPPIIDNELWNKAQHVIRNPEKRKRRNKNEPEPLLSKTVCMKCHKAMAVFYAYSKGKKYKYFRCRSCSNYVNTEMLLKEAANTVIVALGDFKWRERASSILNKDVKIEETCSDELHSLESEIRRLKRSKSRYLRLFESYKISDTNAFTDRIAEIESTIRILENKKLDLRKDSFHGKSILSSEESIERLKKGLYQLEPAAVRLASCLISRIEANKNEIRIYLL